MKKSILQCWQQAGTILPNHENLKKILDLFVYEPVFHSLFSLFDIKQEFDMDFAFKQIAIKHQGGSCRIINLAAKKLLHKVGYHAINCIATELVHVHKTPVARGTGVHMTMIVTVEINGTPKQFLFDPGNFNGPRIPIPTNGEVIADVLTSYRIVYDDLEQKYALQAFYEVWITQFLFNFTDLMVGDRLNKYIDFVNNDQHFFRNNIYVLKCLPSGYMHIYNDKFIIHDCSGAKQEYEVAEMGGVKALLIEKFGLSKSIIDQCDLSSGKIKTSTKQLLDRLWQPQTSSPKIGRMIFNHNTESEQPQTNSTSAQLY